jgi:hypothetical protein
MDEPLQFRMLHAVIELPRSVPVAVFIRCLTLLTMLLHSVYGCGWHHIHGCMSHCAKNSEVAHLNHFGHTHAHSHFHDESSGSDCPASHDQHSSECDHTECSFVATAAVSLEAQPEYSFRISGPQANAALSSLVNTEVCVRPIHSCDTHAPAFCARIQVWRT